jgi:hypothetical protein
MSARFDDCACGKPHKGPCLGCSVCHRYPEHKQGCRNRDRNIRRDSKVKPLCSKCFKRHVGICKKCETCRAWPHRKECRLYTPPQNEIQELETTTGVPISVIEILQRETKEIQRERLRCYILQQDYARLDKDNHEMSCEIQGMAKERATTVEELMRKGEEEAASRATQQEVSRELAETNTALLTRVGELTGANTKLQLSIEGLSKENEYLSKKLAQGGRERKNTHTYMRSEVRRNERHEHQRQPRHRSRSPKKGRRNNRAQGEASETRRGDREEQKPRHQRPKCKKCRKEHSGECLMCETCGRNHMGGCRMCIECKAFPGHRSTCSNNPRRIARAREQLLEKYGGGGENKQTSGDSGGGSVEDSDTSEDSKDGNDRDDESSD